MWKLQELDCYKETATEKKEWRAKGETGEEPQKKRKKKSNQRKLDPTENAELTTGNYLKGNNRASTKIQV